MAGQDRGRDTSVELTEVRTVLSRAESAMVAVRRGPWRGEPDPEAGEMLAALERVVAELARWRRTGRPLKRR